MDARLRDRTAVRIADIASWLAPSCQCALYQLAAKKTSHFATFPSELVRRCLSAGIPQGGCCPECGAAFAPVVETALAAEAESIGTRREAYRSRGAVVAAPTCPSKLNGPELARLRDSAVTGHRPTCGCGRLDSTGSVVLDPFSGLGTVAQTARQLGARAVGIELNPEYHKIACERVLKPPVWWIREHGKPDPTPDGQLTLFGDQT